MPETTAPTPARAANTIDFTLPSAGIPYEDASGNELIPSGHIQVAAMAGWEEGVLQNPNLNDAAKADKILSACAILPNNFDSRDLTLSDRLMALMAIRTHTFGSEYILIAQCGECEHAWQQTIDLIKDIDCDEMPRKYMEPDEKGDLVEKTYKYNPSTGIVCELPVSKITVTIRMLTGRDDNWMLAEMAKKTTSAFIPKAIRHGSDPGYFMRMARMIRSIKRGEQEEIINHSDARQFAEVFQLVGKLHARDCLRLRKQHDKYDIAMTNGFERNCPACGKGVLIPFRMTPEMFRPSNIE